MRVRPIALSLVVAALAAGCALGVPTTGAKTEPEGRVSVKRRKPLPPPERVNLTLPPSLGMVAAGGGNLIGPDGASLIGNDAGSLVAAGGGNLVAAGGGNAVAPRAFGLLQAPTGCEPMPTGSKSFLPLVFLNSAAYVDAVMVANATLRAAREADANAEEPFAVGLPNDERGTGMFTPRGETGGLLRVSAGEAFDASKLVLSLAYESAQKGRLLYRASSPHEAFGRLAMRMDFDLAAGRVSADGASDATIFPPDKCGKYSPKARAHWEFLAPKAAGGPVFTMRVAANFAYPGEPENSGARGMVMNFDAKHRGAARMGRVLPGEAELKFTREDGEGYTDDPALHPAAYFLAATGAQLPPAEADEPLKALLPTLADFPRPFPADLGEADPLAEPIFSFLE